MKMSYIKANSSQKPHSDTFFGLTYESQANITARLIVFKQHLFQMHQISSEAGL